MNKKLEKAEFELFDAQSKLGYLNSTLDSIMGCLENKGLGFLKIAKEYVQEIDQRIFDGRRILEQLRDGEAK